jgi:acetylornithine/succinyldiaminopimelate/putrescine aminotransferase
MLKDHDMLVAFTEYNRNVIRLLPPLVTTRSDIDRFCDAFDELLSRGVARIVADYLRKVAVK